MRTAVTLPTRRPGRRALRRRESARVKTIDAPTGGWVVSENEADLPEDSAGTMENWYPEPDSVRLRPGSINHANLPRPFDLVAANVGPRGISKSGTRLYVVDTAVDKIFVYNAFTGANIPDEEFDLDAANDDAEGCYSDGTTLWVVDQTDNFIYAYTISSGARDNAKEFALTANNDDPEGITSNGTTMWVADQTDNLLYAYVLATGAADAGNNITLTGGGGGNLTPRGLYVDTTHIWVADSFEDDIFAYLLSGGAEVPALRITLATENDAPRGLTGDPTGVGMLWVADTTDNRIYVYERNTGNELTGGGPVNTMFSYHAGTDENLFAGADGKIFEVTNPTVTLRWRGNQVNDYGYTNFATAANQYLIMVNGADHPVNYDGTNFQDTPTITGTGFSPVDFDQVVAYRNRLYFVQKDSANVIFLEVDAIGGPGQILALGGFLKFGGRIVAGATWTIDAGEGPDDYLVFISSEGEIIIYVGTDPTEPANFRQVGKFFAGRPIGRHCLLNIGTDVIALTTDGLISLARAIRTDRTASDRTAFTDRIEKAFNEAFRLVGDVTGWQITTYPTLNMAIINVPVVSGVSAEQYVMNVLNGSWARFIGMNAFHWIKLRDAIYWGGLAGEIRLFDSGSNDAGIDIEATLIGGYDDMGHTGRLKHVISGQAYYQADALANIGVGFAADFKDPGEISQTAPPGGGAANRGIWDASNWDEAVWAAPSEAVAVARVTGNAVGHRIAPVITANTATFQTGATADVRFNSIDVLYEVGAIVG